MLKKLSIVELTLNTKYLNKYNDDNYNYILYNSNNVNIDMSCRHNMEQDMIFQHFRSCSLIQSMIVWRIDV